MIEKKRVTGFLAIVLVAGLAAILWSLSTESGPEQSAGTNRTEPDPADAERPTVTQTGAGPANRAAEIDRTRIEAEAPKGVDVPEGPVVVVRGIVRDTDGQPIAGVSVLTVGARRGGLQAFGSAGKRSAAKTDENGRYELEVKTRREARSLRLAASAFGWVSSMRQVAVAGSELTCDFVLRTAAVLRGRVTDTVGAGIADARVMTFRPLSRPVTTDDDGYFALGDLDPNSGKGGNADGVYVEASARGFVARGVFITIDRENDEDVVIVLSAGAVVRGIVRGPEQQPVADSKLTITTFKSKSQARLEATTDSNGRFEFAGVPTGRYELVAAHEEFASAIETIDVPSAGQTLELTLELSPGRMLRGVVRASTGGPVAGAAVRVRPSGTGKGRQVTLRSAETDEQGAFELHGLPLETLRLECRAEGFVPNLGESAAPTIVYREIVMDPAASIAGTVVDALTGAPVTEFTVRLRGVGGQDGKGVGKGGALQFSDELGQWDTAELPLPNGYTTDVEVSAKGYAPTRVAGLVARTNASPDDHLITLSSGVTLRGIVTSEAGVPMAGSRLQLVSGAGDAAPARGKGGRGGAGGRRTQAEADGRFSFTNVPHGDVRIVVERRDAGVFVHGERIPEGQSDWHVTIVVSAQGELAVVVRDPGGDVAAGIDVRAVAVDVPGVRGRSWGGKSDATGHFVFRDLPFGVYRVSRTEMLAGKSLDTFARHVTVVDTTPLEVELRGTGAATVRATLIADFVFADDSIAQLIPQYADDVPVADRSRASAFTRAQNGSFVFEGIEPGPYTLRAWGHDAGTDRWRPGEVDVEVAERGETRVDVTVR